MTLGSLSAACAFLDVLELIEKLYPADVAVFAFQACTGSAVVGRCCLGGTAGTTVEESYVANAVQAILKCGKGRTLREKHEDTVEAFVEVGVFFWFEELKSEVGKHRGFEQLHQFVDLDEHVDRHFKLGKDLEKIVGLLISLSKETQGECGDSVMAP
jgi:hypothetical protein